jgi:hypothetical protein
MGLSARALLDLSRQGKPKFEDFWDDRRKKVEHPVHTAICLWMMVAKYLSVCRENSGYRPATRYIRSDE